MIPSQQVSGSYFTLVHHHPYQKQKCMPPRRIHLVNTPASSIKTPPSLPAKKKSVRFCSDEDLEQVRLFIKTQTPLSVHSDPPPVPTTRLDIHYPNWPPKFQIYKSLSTAMIRMENVQLVENKVLMGRCRVANLAFEKQVTVRYSLDHWKSYAEIKASFREALASINSPRSWDRFTFDIDLPLPSSSTSTTTCWIALCYHVNQQEFWDNNDGKNYQIDLVPISSAPSTPPLQLSDTDEEEEEEDEPTLLYPEPSPSPRHALDQLKSRYSFSNAPPTNTPTYQPTSSLNHTLSSPQLGYQDFISKYCFYNSSIIQN